MSAADLKTEGTKISACDTVATEDSMGCAVFDLANRLAAARSLIVVVI
jgi:hypothetical protein